MSFGPGLQKFIKTVDPVSGKFDVIGGLINKPTPPAPPGPPNPNDAANAAQSATDAMRMRRGLMSNIYAGAGMSAPVAGKTTLGT